MSGEQTEQLYSKYFRQHQTIYPCCSLRKTMWCSSREFSGISQIFTHLSSRQLWDSETWTAFVLNIFQLDINFKAYLLILSLPLDCLDFEMLYRYKPTHWGRCVSITSWSPLKHTNTSPEPIKHKRDIIKRLLKYMQAMLTGRFAGAKCDKNINKKYIYFILMENGSSSVHMHVACLHKIKWWHC